MEGFNNVFASKEDAIRYYLWGMRIRCLTEIHRMRAIQTLDDPESTPLQRSNALAFAEAYKILTRDDAGERNKAICIDNKGKRDLRAR